MIRIPFNKPYCSGLELQYIKESINSGKISGDGVFTKKCSTYFENKFSFKKSLLTTSCTDALEMAAILSRIEAGDEVIAPSYTFVSTVNAFVLRGAKIKFCDSLPNHPNIDYSKIEELITPKTKAIVIVHYGGIACHMDEILAIAQKHNLILIEDAAQAIDSYYNNVALGTFGPLAAFSFHETKNIICGEGGMLAINDEKYIERAEIIREKGTNRSKFFRGEVDKYGWVDIGSSFLMSDISAAYLYAQLENLEDIQKRRIEIWNAYHKLLKTLADQGFFSLSDFPKFSTQNGHVFYIIMNNIKERQNLLEYLKSKGIYAVFHYLSLHKSTYYLKNNKETHLANADHFANGLIRLPLFYELTDSQIEYICDSINQYFLKRSI